MLDELRHCGIYDDVAQWQSLDDLLHSLTVFSTCWHYCFPGLPLPSIPIEEYESITQLPWLGLILEVLVVVRIALQIPNRAMSSSNHTVANRYELHRCRCAAYLLISFLQRLITQDHGYFPPFFEVLHFYKTSLLCEIMHSTFADTRHLRSLRARFPDLYDFIYDPGHHQQPCVYIRLSPWHTPYYVGATDQDVLRREHSRSRIFLQLLRGRHAFFEPALHYWKRSNTYWLYCAVPVEIKLPVSSVWVQESKWQYLLRPHLNAPWVHRILRKVGFREHLVDFRRHSLSSPTSIGLHKRFRRRLHPDLERQLRPDALDDIQAHYSILYQLGSNTGASFQVMRDLLSAAFPPTQLYYLLRLAVFVNEPFRSKAQKLLAQVLRKRRLQPPSTLTQLLLPPLHVQNWKARLGTWLQSWIASHRDLFPSLFIPKIRVVETRSATLGDKIYNYRTWQRKWTPDTSFPCRCLDIDDHHLLRAHGHAVMVDDFSRVNADINVEIMAASMKDQFFGDVDLLHQRFTTQLRKLARRWHVHGSDLLSDLQPVVAQLMETHWINLQDRAYWSSTSLQRTVASLSSWVVIPADHFPSRAHVVCPSLFAILMRKTFCAGDVFSLCRESAASFCSEVVTAVPSLLRQRYAWGLRLQAPLPTARIHGQLPSSRSSVRSYLNSPRRLSPTLQVNSRYKNLSSSCGKHCRKQILMSTSTWCRKTCQASSRPFLRNDSIRHFKCFSIDMIKLLAFAVLRNGPCTKSSQIIDAVCSKGSGAVKPRSRESFVNKISGTSSTLSLTTVTSRSTDTCSAKNEELLWDHQPRHRCAIWLLRLRISFGTKP